MNKSAVEARSTNPVLIRAAEWFERLQHEDLSVDEVASWQQWMGESDEHRRAFEGIQSTWERFDFLPVPDRHIQKRWTLRALAATAVVAAGGLGVWKLVENAQAPAMVVFETRAAEHRDARLSDGTTLMLGARSLAWTDFSAQKRAVVLDRGEAFFDVAKDSARPFVVRAGDSTITAIGTAFNVRRSGERIVVAVSAGAVKIAAKGFDADGVQVGAGQQLIVGMSAAAPRVSNSNPETITAWRTGQLQYLGEPLKYVVADVNRYSAEQISIGDAAVGELLVSGTVFENDIDGWLRSLEEILPVTVERGEPGRIVLFSRR